MVTITFSLSDLSSLVGKKISHKDMIELVTYLKGEVEGYDKKENLITVDLDDTNLPFLWSVEGIARFLKGIINKKKIDSKLKIKKSNYEVLVHRDVIKIRPFTAWFVVKGKPLTDFALKQLIQLQEKLTESYGKKRKTISIGLYSFKNIKFPIHFKALDPKSIKFTPLDFDKPMSLRDVMLKHPKAKNYSYVLKGLNKYPVFVDDKNSVLSLVPITNSEETGRLNVDDSSFIFEVSGINKEAVDLACNIFAYALSDRGYELSEVKVKYPTKVISTPTSIKNSITVNFDNVNKFLGLDLSKVKIKQLLEMGGYSVQGNKVLIPDYRADILHERDIIEDVAILYGYHNIKPLPVASSTIGALRDITGFSNKVRSLFVGASFQEVMSPILSNKNLLYDSMNRPDSKDTIEIEDFMSENFSVVRSWLTPILLSFLAKNKHADYPQKIFEQGLVSRIVKGNAVDFETVSAVIAEKNVGFTEIKQLLEFIMNGLNLSFSISAGSHPSFIDGRFGIITVNKKPIGFLGEINPFVLEKFGLVTPVACLEFSFSELV